MKVLLSILVSTLIASSYTATFSINSVSTCTNTSSTGFCTRWQQNGSVTETTSCFPAETELYVLDPTTGQQSVKKMQYLQIGDYVLAEGKNGEQYAEVIGWLHRAEGMGEYLEIAVGNGNGVFFVSGKHNVGVQGGYVFAEELKGKVLSNGMTVKSVEKAIRRGIYAPLTSSYNFYVKASENKDQKVLAHSFANIKNPQFYQPFVHTIWKTWQIIYGESTSNQIHPAAEWMMNKFGFLLEL